MQSHLSCTPNTIVGDTGWRRLRFLMLNLALCLLGACSSSDDSPKSEPTVSGVPGVPGVSGVFVSGLAIDGPLANAEVTVFDSSVGVAQVGQTNTGPAGRFTVEIPATAVYPLTFRVNGGRDTVSNTAASIRLAGVIANANQTPLLTPFSTLAVRHAECRKSTAVDMRNARNALTNSSVQALLGSGLTFGLHPDVRSQLLAGIPSTPVQSASLLLSSEQMAETLRRTAAARGLSADDVLTAIACDLINGTLDGSESESSPSLAAAFQLVAAEVGLEAASGRLRVGAVDANPALNAALAATFPTAGTSLATLTVGTETLNLLRQVVHAAFVAQPSTGLLNLFEALNGLAAPLEPSALAAVLASLTNQTPLRPLILAPGIPSAAILTAVQTPVTPAPVIDSFTTTPGPGNLTTITWSSQRATVCERGGPVVSGWNGLGVTSGSLGVGPLTGNTTFTLKCAGSGGVTTANLPVVVLPIIEISFDPVTADFPGNVTINFDTSNANSCTSRRSANTGGPVNVDFVDGESVPVHVNLNVNVTCTNSVGTQISIKSLPVRAARLTWVAPTSTNDGSPLTLEGYKVYHGTTSGSRSGTPIVINNPLATEYTQAFPSGPRFFEITAIGNGNLESSFSNEATKVIP